MKLKVLTWNLRRAKEDSNAWKIIYDTGADILLLQEVASIPSFIQSSYKTHNKRARSKNGLNQKFSTVILVKDLELKPTQLISNLDYVSTELEYFEGNILSCEVAIAGYTSINLVSIYSPAWPLQKDRLRDNDFNCIKLIQNKDIYCTELLWSALKSNIVDNPNPWIVAGDFNSSVTFDYMWPGGPRGNLEIIDRMNELGFYECLSVFSGCLVPTFRNAKGKKVIHQMDHVYASQSLFEHLESCHILDTYGIFENSISDHLPIISTFRLL